VVAAVSGVAQTTVAPDEMQASTGT
jgi:hypothetical protein